MQHGSIARGWIIALLLMLAGGVIYIGFDTVGKEALIESALFQKDASLLQRMGVTLPTQHAHRSAP